MSATPVFNLPARLTGQPAPSISIPGFIADLRSTGATKDTKLADALEALQQYADSINQILTTIIGQLKAAGIVIPSVPTVIFEEEHTLTSPSTALVLSNAPVVNALLIVVIIQDGAGSRQFTWPSTVKWATNNIDVTLLTVSAFLFFGRVDPVDSVKRWFNLTEAPITGQTP